MTQPRQTDPPGPALALVQPPPPGPTVPVDVPAAVEQFQTPLLRYVIPMLRGDHEQAQDIVQDTFLRLHRHLQQHGSDSIQSLSTWLYRVAHNLVMDHGRKTRREHRLQQSVAAEALAASHARHDPEAPGSPDAASPADLERREAASLALAHLHQLPDDLRELLLLRLDEGLTLRQIAQVTGLSAGNVCVRVNQGLRQLAQRLHEAGAV